MSPPLGDTGGPDPLHLLVQHRRPADLPSTSWSTSHVRAHNHSGSSALRQRAWWARSAIAGIPSGRRFPLAFGMNTRRTGKGWKDRAVRCTSTARSILAGAVNTTRPSTPAVPRPALRCVTCRTLTSVFDQLRSIIFCRFLTAARSPAFDALKILHRSRRTSSSCTGHTIVSQSRFSSSGPFTITVSNLPFGSGGFGASSFKGSPATRQPAFAAGHQARYPASYPKPHRLERPATNGFGFLLPFGHRRSLLGRPVPATGFRLPHGRPTTTHPGVMDLTGFPRSARMRHDRVGCQLYPGSGGIHATVEPSSVAACRFATARSLSSPPPRPDPGSYRNQASPLVHSRSPFRSSPYLLLPGRNGRPWASLWASYPAITSHARQRRGPVQDTDRSHVFDIEVEPPIGGLLSTCDLVSHRMAA